MCTVPRDVGRPRSAGAVEVAVRGIVRSDEPAVVLSSLARCSNPSFSDACAVELSEGTEALFQVRFPVPDQAGAAHAAGRTVTTEFGAGSYYGYPSFAGVVVHTWTGRKPTEEDVIIARLLVDRALAIVQQERLAQSAARADDRAAKLAVELITSRAEGEAIGLLMASRRTTREEAARLLRLMSRTSHRALHEVAADVVYGAYAERPEHLHLVAPGGSAPRACGRASAVEVEPRPVR